MSAIYWVRLSMLLYLVANAVMIGSIVFPPVLLVGAVVGFVGFYFLRRGLWSWGGMRSIGLWLLGRRF